MGLKHDKGVADSWDQLESISTYAFCSFHVLLTISAFQHKCTTDVKRHATRQHYTSTSHQRE